MKRVNITNNYQNSYKTMQGMVGRGKDYDIGFLGHTSKQHFWKTGDIKLYDCWQLLGEWLQTKGNMFKEAPKPLDEKTANTMLKEEWVAYLKDQTTKLQGLYKGSGEALFHRHLWYVVSIDRASNQFHVTHGAWDTNMKNAVRNMGRSVYNTIVKPERDWAYLYLVKQTTAFHCSEGALDAVEMCRTMLGWAIYHRYLDPKDRVFYNPYLPSNHADAKFVAYLRDGASKEIVKLNLTQDYGKSVKMYNELRNSKVGSYQSLAQESEGKVAVASLPKYVAGVIGHSQRSGWWLPYSLMVGDVQYFDIYHMLAEYTQKTLNVHKTSGNDEKAANVTTRKSIETKWKAELDTLQKLYKGKGETLQRTQYSFVATFHEHSNEIKIGSQYNSRSLKAAYNYHSRWIYNTIIKTFQPLEYIIGLGSSRALLQCSDGKPTESVPCQRMIGWAVANGYFREGNAKLAWDATDEKRLCDNRIAPQSDLFEYYALVMDHRKDGAPIKKIVLGNAAQRSEALGAYKALFQGGAQAEATAGVFIDKRSCSINSYRMTRYKGRKIY